jgi:cytochrome c-type biogenesis protein CcmH/NrfF
MNRFAAILITILIGLGALAAPTFAAPPQTSLPELEDQVMCPICGTLLGLSRSPAAERERVFIRKLIRQGRTEGEIKDALVAEYGPQVLALPDDSGINVWAYIVPVFIFGLALLAVGWTIGTWRRGRSEPRSPADSSEPNATDEERLDRDLGRFDL